MSRTKPAYECSPELKSLFIRELEIWKNKHHSPISELARRCGVTSTYLNQIARYGRVPSKPVLMLLAFNMELKEKDLWFRAAQLNEVWPYPTPYHLSDTAKGDNDFISLKVDIDGIAEKIRDAIREDTQPKTMRNLTEGKKLLIGLNAYQQAFFQPLENEKSELPRKKGLGFFDELLDLLSVMLRCEIETVEVPRTKCVEMLQKGEIDLYGPVASSFGIQGIGFTDAFCQLGVSAVCRIKSSPALEALEIPETVEELIDLPYKICVLRDSRSHMLVSTRFKKTEDDLILCDSAEEAAERLILGNITRPGHIFISDSLTAFDFVRRYPEALALRFATEDSLLKLSNICLAVRPDWPELVDRLNQCLQFLLRTGSMAEHLEPYLDEQLRQVVSLSTESSSTDVETPIPFQRVSNF